MSSAPHYPPPGTMLVLPCIWRTSILLLAQSFHRISDIVPLILMA